MLLVLVVLFINVLQVFFKSSYPIIRFPMTKYLFLISTFIPTLELSRYKLVNQ